MDSVGIASSPFIFAEPIIAQSYKTPQQKASCKSGDGGQKNTQAIPGAWVLVRTEEAFPCLRNRYLVPSRTVADNSLPLIHMPGAAWGRKYYTPTNWKICKGKYIAAPSCPDDFVLASEGVRRNRPGSLKKSACHEMLNHHEGKPDLWDPVVSSFGWPPGRRYGGTVAAQAPPLHASIGLD